MSVELEPLIDRFLPCTKAVWVAVNEEQVVHVAQVGGGLELSLNKVVQAVKIDISSKLAGEIADREPKICGLREPTFCGCYQVTAPVSIFEFGTDPAVVAINDVYESADRWERRVRKHEFAECGSVDGHKKPCKVQLEHPHRRASAPADVTHFLLKVFECPVDSLAFAASKTGADKFWFSDRLHDRNDEVVDDSIPKFRRKNFAGLGLGDGEAFHGSRAVGAGEDFFLKLK